MRLLLTAASLKIHLHRWIIIKACYYIRNMKLKRPSAASEYDTLADMDGEDLPSPRKLQLVVQLPIPSSKVQRVLSPSQSPNGTPKSITPPADAASATAGAELSARPVGGKKRKSSMYMSLSDGEDMGSAPAKRPYQSYTMPNQRKSPRKSLKSITDSPVSENIPPIPSLDHSQSNSPPSAAGPATASEPGRPLLTPLSSNDLNGTARPASAAPPSNSGFTAVNTGGSFTAVNASPPVKEAPAPNPAPSNGRSYSSPYDSTPFGAPPTQTVANPPKGPPLNTAQAISHGFQAINSPSTVTNGVSARNSPVVQHNSHVHIPSQHQAPAPASSSSRSNTPVAHHSHRSSLAPQRSSRSNTPIAPALPAQAIQPAPSAQPTTHPHASSTPVVAMQATPVAHIQPAVPLRTHQVAAPAVATAVHYVQAQPVLKSQPIEPAMHPQPIPTVDLNLLQCEVLGYLMQYLFPRQASPPEEATLLHKMETLWHHGTPVFRKQIGQLYDLHSKVLISWMTERRKIAQLRHTVTYSPGVSAHEMVDRLLAMNDLRVMRLKWKNMSSADGSSAEDLLCSTFAVMTNTEGTEYLFKDGLDRLTDGIFEFLRSEDMKILMHKR